MLKVFSILPLLADPRHEQRKPPCMKITTQTWDGLSSDSEEIQV